MQFDNHSSNAVACLMSPAHLDLQVMGKNTSDPVAHVPYAGQLKKVFEPILDANMRGETNGGKRYWPKRDLTAPRQWYLEVQKQAHPVKFGLRVVVNAATPPATDTAFTCVTNIVVTNVKHFHPYVILWVANNSGMVANLYFTEGEDLFQARPFTDSLTAHESDLRAEGDKCLLTRKAIAYLNSEDNHKLSRVLLAVVRTLKNWNRAQIPIEGVQEKTRSKKRPPPAPVSCSPAPSRAKSKKGKQAVTNKEVQEAEAEVVNLSPEQPMEFSSEDEEFLNVGDGDHSPEQPPPVAERTIVARLTPPVASLTTPVASLTPPVAGSQLTTGNVEGDIVAGSPRPAKRRRKQTSTVRFSSTLVPNDAGTIPVENIEREGNASATPGAPSPLKRRKKERRYQHPVKTAEGKDIDYDDCREELKQFKIRSAPMYIWGQDFTKEIDVDQMINAPIEFKYRPFHETCCKNLFEIYLTGIHPPKQTLTLMPKVDKKPCYFDNVKDGEFYIINGQHSVAAAKKLLALD